MRLNWDEQDRAIDAAIRTFPKRFGLRAFPGKTFKIVRSHCLWDTGEYHGYPQNEPGPLLYTFVQDEDQWLAFAKGSPAELRRELVGVPQ